MISLIKYLSARQRLIGVRKTIVSLGGSREVSSLMLAQEDMYENEATYYYYKALGEIIIILLFVAVCGTIYGVVDESYLRTLWSTICSWYAQTMAWGQLQTETILHAISR